MPSLLPFPKSQSTEWIGNRYTLPKPLRDGDELITVDVVLWLELPSGLMVGTKLIETREPVSLATTLDETMAQPAAGPPRRPARIRVPNARMAKELRDVAGGIPIFVAPTPELDEAFVSLSEHMEGSEPEPSYLGDGDIPPDVVLELFIAAGLLFRAAPWELMVDQQIVRVDIPSLNVDGAVVSIIGAAGESFGLLLFSSLQTFLSFCMMSALESDELPNSNSGADESVVFRSLSFDRKKDLHPRLAREIKQHRWPVAGPKAYPVLLCLDSGKVLFETTERDVRILTASTRAFLTFFEKHRDLFADEYPDPISESFQLDDDMTVTITAPYQTNDGITMADLEIDDGPFDDDFIDEPTIRIAAPHVGRNDPCPCGSGKKYKKCHLERDS
jgi:hypothetical protein